MRQFTDEEKYRCLERELRRRRNVYPNRIETGRMTQHEADYQITIMEAVLEDYRAKAELPL